jgi:hypothetical protein
MVKIQHNTTMKTAILIGGYARSGKSSALSHLQQTLPIHSTSQELSRHVKILIPYLEKLDFTSDTAKALTFPVSTAYVTTAQIYRALTDLGHKPDYCELFEIYKNHHQRLSGKTELTIRDICIAVAESTRLIYPDIYVDLVLRQTSGLNLVAMETIGGKECSYMYSELKSLGYRVIGQNIRRKTELAGVDIRELIKDAQCDILNRDIHNNHSKKYLADELDSIILSIRDE